MVLKHVDGHSKTIAVRCGSSSNLGGHLDVAKPWLWSAVVIFDAHAWMAGDLSCVQAHSTETKWRRPA